MRMGTMVDNLSLETMLDDDLTANQAAGGFRVDNQAGKRTQSALNEDDSIAWTREALAHYRITLGDEGDGRYLQGWSHREGGNTPFRWSAPVSRLLLPVVPGEPYTITLDLNTPDRAMTPEAGLYLDGKKLAPLQAGSDFDITQTLLLAADFLHAQLFSDSISCGAVLGKKCCQLKGSS